MICDTAESVTRQVNSATVQRLIESKDFAHNETFIERGCSAYVLVDGPDWEDSQSNAKELGGNLVTINDSDEWEWFRNEYVPDRYAYPDSYKSYTRGEVQLWVGMNDIDSEGELTWVSGESSGAKPSELNLEQGASPNKDNYGVWQWEQQRITTYDKNFQQRKKDGWTEEANNIRGVVEISICE